MVVKKPILSFDLTGTLATYRFCDAVWFEGLPQLYAQKHHLGIDESREYLTGVYQEVGDQRVEWYDIKYWFQRFDLGNGWNALLKQFSHHIEFYPETPATLEQYRQNYDLVLITNACREFAEVEIASIKEYLSNVISCTSDFGEVKKTPQFYHKVCQSLGEDPADWFHVGDHWQFDYVAPRGIGMTAFYLDRTRETDGEFIIHHLSELASKLL